MARSIIGAGTEGLFIGTSRQLIVVTPRPWVDVHFGRQLRKLIPEAVDGYGGRVESPGELPAALKRGLTAVLESQPAILNVQCQRVVG